MIDSQRPPHDREHHDPDEETHPLPRSLIALALALGLWGAWYLATPEGTVATKYGDQRTASALSGAMSGASVNGAQIYTSKCAGCHQSSGLGVPGVFPPLAQSSWVLESPSRLVQILLHGIQGPIEVRGVVYSGAMPAWRSLSDEELAAVARYVRGAFGNGANTSALTPAFVASVRAASASRTAPFNGGAELLTVP